jgi:hypothetical protein
MPTFAVEIRRIGRPCGGFWTLFRALGSGRFARGKQDRAQRFTEHCDHTEQQQGEQPQAHHEGGAISTGRRGGRRKLGHGAAGVYNLPPMRNGVLAGALAFLCSWCWSGTTATAAVGAAAKPKYYFNVRDVNADPSVEAPTLAVAKQVLHEELARRREFTSEVGPVGDDDALVAELKRRKLQGFNVTMKLVSLSAEPKPPRPGGRLKQLAVGVKLSVFGATIPEAKLAFGGDGEAMVEAEVVEQRLPEEQAALTKDVLVQAVKLAVDQAVRKLALPKAKPIDESRRRRAKP